MAGAKDSLDMADGCLRMVKETIEQLGEDCSNTPPMMYPEAIANLCSKRNRRIAILERALDEALVMLQTACGGVGVMDKKSTRKHLEEKACLALKFESTDPWLPISTDETSSQPS